MMRVLQTIFRLQFVDLPVSKVEKILSPSRAPAATLLPAGDRDLPHADQAGKFSLSGSTAPADRGHVRPTAVVNSDNTPRKMAGRECVVPRVVLTRMLLLGSKSNLAHMCSTATAIRKNQQSGGNLHAGCQP
jgi:hypothetical protein